MKDFPLEPLADYLRLPLSDVYGGKYENLDSWTDELRSAVEAFILRDGSQQLVEEVVTIGDYADISSMAEEVMKRNAPWRVAYMFHLAAVRLLPTLDALLEVEGWSYEDQGMDVVYWFECHATEEQFTNLWLLAALAVQTKPSLTL